MYKRFELQCELRNEYRNPEWKEVGLWFDTEEEMITYVKKAMKENRIRIKAVFKMEKLDNDMFL